MFNFQLRFDLPLQQLTRWQHGHYFLVLAFARQTLFAVLLFLCINAVNYNSPCNAMRSGHIIGMLFTNGCVCRSRLTKTAVQKIVARQSVMFNLTGLNYFRHFFVKKCLK